MKKKSRRQRSPEEIARILEEFRQSGQSQRVFAKERRLAVSTLQFWLRKERSARLPARRPEAPASASRLVPVRIVDRPAVLDGATIELEFSGGETLRFPVGLAPALLAGYVEAVDRRC